MPDLPGMLMSHSTAATSGSESSTTRAEALLAASTHEYPWLVRVRAMLRRKASSSSTTNTVIVDCMPYRFTNYESPFWNVADLAEQDRTPRWGSR